MERQGDKIVLDKVGYLLKGVAKIKTWYGNMRFINMNNVKVDNIDEKTIEDNINDAGFGCQEIMGAYVDIYELFEEDVTIYCKSVRVGDMTEDDVANLDKECIL
jgi:hypothetical protein